MKKKFLSFILALTMMTTVIVAEPVAEAAETPSNVTSSNQAAHWFYDQLSNDAKTIYHILCSMDMTDGKTNYDLAQDFDQAKIKAYATGADRQLFNDFTAAKDAWDLEHSEVWYADSSYISFRPTVDNAGQYHVYIGTGRSTDYYVQGVTSASDVAAKDAQVKAVIDEIVAGAQQVSTSGSANEVTARKVSYVHDQVTRKISYRFEPDCSEGNSGYIRTLYALVTHEGVCESYARSMQVILTKLNIPCVIVMGTQTSGDQPEQHMWNAVRIGNEWYIVDATWDDPVAVNKDGSIRKRGQNGNDGGEVNNYLLVGADVTNENWAPSGFVSSSAKEFTYPTIAQMSYDSSLAFTNEDGFNVVYSESDMEGSAAGVFDVSFKGMGAEKSGQQGYYFLLKMYGSEEETMVKGSQEWYYATSWNWALEGKNPYFNDNDKRLHVVTAQCPYLEFAITTKPQEDNWQTALYGMPDFAYHGNGTDIICETGLLYNQMGEYKAPPYVKKQFPDPTGKSNVGEVYRVHVEFDDELYHPDSGDSVTLQELGLQDQQWYIDNNSIERGPQLYKEAEAECKMYQEAFDKAKVTNPGITLEYYDCTKGKDGNYGKHTLSPEGQQQQVFENIVWLYEDGTQSDINIVEPSKKLIGIEFDFSASPMWADDNVLYQFSLEGLVGRSSKKTPNQFGWVFYNPSCPKGYRSQGIDWNVWGQPSMLDNPSDLDLSKVVLEGASGHKSNLDALQKNMNVDDINGRLMLVVEDLSTSRPRTNEVNEALDAFTDDFTDENVVAKSMYEIGFTRICNEVVMETGQSIRLSMGFPTGYNADSNVIFKAYHFDRNEQGEITGVQEIPIAVTPYGLVILCSSFSPFELVAYDADNVTTDSKTYRGNVVVSTDGNGEVFVDDRSAPATGMNGIINFGESDAHKFRAVPKKGYVVDAAAFAGTQISITTEADGSATFALTSEQILDRNDILNVTFVPESIKAEEEAAKEQTVLPDLNDNCSHGHVTKIEHKNPTCTEIGYDSGETCADCGTVLEPSNPIDALGHDFGADGKCTRCNAVKGSVDVYDPAPTPGTNQPSGDNTGTNPNNPAGDNTEANPNNPANPTPDVIPDIENTKPAESVDAVITGSNVTVNSIDVSKLVNEDGDATNAVVIDMTSVGNGAHVDSADLPSDAMEELVKSGVPEIAMKFSTATINFDAAALQTIAGQTRGNAFVKVAVNELKKETLNDKQKKSVGNRKVYTGIEATISVNGSSAVDKIRDFGSGNVTLSIPFQPDASTDPKGLAVWYADDQGGLVRHITKYEDNHIIFATSHFSSYIVMYEEPISCALDASCPINSFNDADMHEWYHDGVHYMISHNYMYGTNKGFEPSLPVTRAMVIQMLYAIAKPSESYPASPFTDVDPSAWYAEAVNWAAAVGVTAGYGEGQNRTFMPNEEISRQQLATMLHSYADKPACVGNVATYADSSSVADWAKDALIWATNYGIITGKPSEDNLLLDPSGKALRSQTATMIMQFVRRTI